MAGPNAGSKLKHCGLIGGLFMATECPKDSSGPVIRRDKNMILNFQLIAAANLSQSMLQNLFCFYIGAPDE